MREQDKTRGNSNIVGVTDIWNDQLSIHAPNVVVDMIFCSPILNLSKWSLSSLLRISAFFKASVSLLLLLALLILVRVRRRLFLLLGEGVLTDPSMMSAMLLLLLLTEAAGELVRDMSSLMALSDYVSNGIISKDMTWLHL